MQVEVTVPHDTALPLQRAAVDQALAAALRVLPDLGHNGYAHPTGAPFRYAPRHCVGCMRAVIKRLAEGDCPS